MQACRGSQSEIGSRQRDACWASVGEASRESRRRSSAEFFSRDFRAQPRKAEVGEIEEDEEEVQASEGSSAQGGRSRSRSQKGGTSEGGGRKSRTQAWPGRANLEEIVDVRLAQTRLCVDGHLQKATEGGLSVESLGVHVLRAVSTRASPLGDFICEMLRTSCSPTRPPSAANSLELGAVCLGFVARRRRTGSRDFRSKDHRRHVLHGVGCWSLLTICILNFLYAGNGHFHESRVCRNKPRPAQLAAIRRIVGDALWLIRRAPEDGAVKTTAKDFAQVLKRKRVTYTGEEVSRPQPLMLLEIIPGLPPAGTVGIVDPLSIATGEGSESIGRSKSCTSSRI